MLIARRPDSTHWYLPTGEPFYTVPKKDGTGDRPAHIGDAFKAGAYRSVTNVLGVIAKPGLVKWQIEQGILAALTLPRIPPETDHQFAERAIEDASVQSREAAKRGEELHNHAANYLEFGAMPEGEDLRLLAPFFAWCQQNVRRHLAVEKIGLNRENAYAGRLDSVVEMLDGSTAIIDIKTQDVKLDKKTAPTPVFYEEWFLQLAAYSRCQINTVAITPPHPYRLLSIIVDRNRPGCWAKEWTSRENCYLSSEGAYQVFLAVCRLWAFQKGGTPGIDAKKAA